MTEMLLQQVKNMNAAQIYEYYAHQLAMTLLFMPTGCDVTETSSYLKKLLYWGTCISRYHCISVTYSMQKQYNGT